MFYLIEKLQSRQKLLRPRYERKIKINENQLNLILNKIQLIGFFKKYPDQEVNSLYFDDNELNFARSNINGDKHRLKARVRWYGDNKRNLKNEFKIKIGFNGFKLVSSDMFNKNKSFDENIRLLKIFYNKSLNKKLTEIVFLKYLRSYYQHPSGVRLTFDKKISFKKICDNNYNLLPFEVLEFKYENYLDNYFRNIFYKLGSFPLRLSKCSKYVEALSEIF